MKKWYQTSLAIFLLGLILLMIGASNNGFQSLISRSLTAKVTVLSNKKKVQINRKLPAFQKLTFNSSDTNVQIKLGKTYQLQLIGAYKQPVKIKQDGSQLQIITKQPNFNFVNIAGTKAPKLVLTVPQKHDVQQLRLQTTDSNVQVQQLKLQQLLVSQHDSRLTLKNVQAKQVAQTKLWDSNLRAQNCVLPNWHWQLADSSVQAQHVQANLQGQLQDSQVKMRDLLLQDKSHLKLADSHFNVQLRQPVINYRIKGRETVLKIAGRQVKNDWVQHSTVNSEQLNLKAQDSHITLN